MITRNMIIALIAVTLTSSAGAQIYGPPISIPVPPSAEEIADANIKKQIAWEMAKAKAELDASIEAEKKAEKKARESQERWLLQEKTRASAARGEFAKKHQSELLQEQIAAQARYEQSHQRADVTPTSSPTASPTALPSVTPTPTPAR